MSSPQVGGFDFQFRFFADAGDDVVFVFRPPWSLIPYIQHRRGLGYRIRRGVSVFRIDGVWFEQPWPSAEQQRMADRFYLGGHRHDVNRVQRQELIGAGYGALITVEVR